MGSGVCAVVCSNSIIVAGNDPQHDSASFGRGGWLTTYSTNRRPICHASTSTFWRTAVEHLPVVRCSGRKVKIAILVTRKNSNVGSIDNFGTLPYPTRG